MKFLIVIDVILGVITFVGQAILSLPFKIIGALLSIINKSVGAAILAIPSSGIFSFIMGVLKLPFIILTAIIILMFLLKLIKKFIAKRREKKYRDEMIQQRYSNSNNEPADSMNFFR